MKAIFRQAYNDIVCPLSQEIVHEHHLLSYYHARNTGLDEGR